MKDEGDPSLKGRFYRFLKREGGFFILPKSTYIISLIFTNPTKFPFPQTTSLIYRKPFDGCFKLLQNVLPPCPPKGEERKIKIFLSPVLA